MNEKKYLTEENYQRANKKVKKIALIVFIIGFLIGGSLIAAGFITRSNIIKSIDNNNAEQQENQKTEKANTEKEIESLEKSLAEEKTNLEKEQANLDQKVSGVQTEIKKLEREPFTGFDDAYYARKDKIDELKKSIAKDEKSLKLINDILDDEFDYCKFEGKTNEYTKKYCEIKNNISSKKSKLDDAEFFENDEFDSIFNKADKEIEASKSIPFFMFGAFIIIASCMIGVVLFFISKRREIMAYTAQQTMPVAQEGIEKMAPTVGNAVKEISKGITEGIKEGKEDK